ncbi:MAG: helix-turn-helix transcriptional regulator [Flavobacteriales bacterium]|nr:helix-turn-helix transcriptional regulator [Flavobacteriales bacterium]
MKYDFYNNNEILELIGKKLQEYRVSKNISQKQLSKITGVSRSRISDIENGSPSSLVSLIEIMRALKILDNIELLIPSVVKSPREVLKETLKKRKRARQ